MTDDNRIAITGGDQCLDEGDNGVQTYQCTTGNDNQVWYIQPEQGGGTGPYSSAAPSSTASVAPSSTESIAPSITSSAAPSATPSSDPNDPYADVPVGTPKKDYSTGGRLIHPVGRNDLCLTVQNGYAGRGTRVAISYCFGEGGSFSDLQSWDVLDNGLIQLHGVEYGLQGCVDAGDAPANGSGAKLWDCYAGLLQQNWSSDGSRFSLGNGQCLDVVKESGTVQAKPYGSVKDIQTWQCSDNNDPYQAFQFWDGN